MAGKILVVDNHPLMLKFMSGLLSKEGYEVLTAKDGLSALDILSSYTPEVIFIDLIMPNINGERLCRIIRKKPELADAYLVILSAIAADEDVEFLGFGADACIAKAPFDQMGRHVLAILKELGSKERGSARGETIGADAMRPREITRELLTVKRHFEVILESMTEGVMELTREARIVYANPMALNLVAIPEERLLASSFEELFEGAEQERIGELLKAQGFSTTEDLVDPPFVMGDKLIMLKFLPIKEEDSGFLVILEDVTEKKRMEARLLQAEKMEAIGNLAGGIAHDFNNILAAILGNVSLAKMRANPADSIFEDLEEVERASWKARDLAQQLLPFSRGGKPIRRPASLPGLLNEICLAAFKHSQIECHVNIADDLWTAEVDAKQVRQALNNLLTNAWRSTPENGVIHVSASNVPEGVELPQPLKRGRYVRISIRDNGCFIPREQLQRIFEPYSSPIDTGEGLGLAAAYSIIDQHQGFLSAESKVGEGATFQILLPAYEAKEDAATKELCQKGLDDRRYKILVMDDEDMVRGVVSKMLEHLGYAVALARRGEEAYELYRNSLEAGDPFDVVILDLTVRGGMGGREIIMDLRKLDPTVKAIVSSGYSNDPVMAHYSECGFSGVLEKPYQVSALESEIRRIITAGAYEA